MATISSAAIRYAEALYALAVEAQAEAAWASDLGAATEAFGTGPGQAFLADRKIPRERKFEVVDLALANLAVEVRNLVKLLASRARPDILGEISEKFQSLWDEARGVAHARVTTAVALDAPERDALRRRLDVSTGKQVEMETEVDPEILGGIVVRIGDSIVDGSARTRLVALKRQLEGSLS